MAGHKNHLILVRQNDPELSGSMGACCRVGQEDLRWRPVPHAFPAKWEATHGFGELYRTLREKFGDRVQFTIVEPRNIVSFIPLVVRDAIRFRVPLGAALRAIASTSNATGVLNGRVIYQGRAPSPSEVVDLVARGLREQPTPAPYRDEVLASR
jgi:hypothetical protein